MSDWEKRQKPAKNEVGGCQANMGGAERGRRMTATVKRWSPDGSAQLTWVISVRDL